jgi:hypothetical protein
MSRYILLFGLAVMMAPGTALAHPGHYESDVLIQAAHIDYALLLGVLILVIAGIGLLGKGLHNKHK